MADSIGPGRTALSTPEMSGPEAVVLGPNVVVAGRYRIKSAIGQGGMGRITLNLSRGIAKPPNRARRSHSAAWATATELALH